MTSDIDVACTPAVFVAMGCGWWPYVIFAVVAWLFLIPLLVALGASK